MFGLHNEQVGTGRVWGSASEQVWTGPGGGGWGVSYKYGYGQGVPKLTSLNRSICGHMGPHPPTADWRADMTENITFPQVRWRAVNIIALKYFPVCPDREKSTARLQYVSVSKPLYSVVDGWFLCRARHELSHLPRSCVQRDSCDLCSFGTWFLIIWPSVVPRTTLPIPPQKGIIVTFYKVVQTIYIL